MRKILILTLALLTMLAVAAPVGAAKGGKPSKPGSVDVTIDANLYWVNAAGDTIYYTINVTSSENIAAAVVEISVDDEETTVLYSGNLVGGTSLDLGYFHLIANLTAHDIEASVTVGTGSETLASDSASVVVEPVEICGFSGTEISRTMAHPGGVCGFDFDPGYWKIVAQPAYPNAGRNPGITMRDHMPGNWCMVGEIEKTGGSRTQPASITMYVDLPTVNPFGYGDWFEVGVCGLGGHGVCTNEDCFFPAGNPATFVLWAPIGSVTATRLGDAPPSAP